MVPPIDDNLELVKAMGGKKGYDPIPPDQYLYFLTSEDELQRVVAWVRSKTLRKGHRSPFAVAENGTRPLTKADMAREIFAGNRAHACRAWDRAAASGIVYLDANKFLCLNGGVQMPAKTRRRKDEPVVPVQVSLPRYLVEKINSLPDDLRREAEADYTRLLEYRSNLEADSLTMARIHGDRLEDSMNRRYFGDGGKKRMDKKHRPDLHEEGSKLVQLNLLLVPEELQKYAGGSVQDTAPVRADDKNGSVQRAPAAPVISVFRGSEKTLSSSSSASGITETTTTNSGPDRIEFHKRLTAAWQAAGKDGASTRAQSEEALRIVGTRADEFLATLTPQKLSRSNHAGIIPTLAEEFMNRAPAPPAAAASTCGRCGGSLEGGCYFQPGEGQICFACVEVPAAVAR
jgi:hypothetical protein